MNRAGRLIRAALVVIGAGLLLLGGVAYASAQTPESGGENATTNDYGETVLSGLDDSDMSLIEKEVEGGDVVLTIRSEESKSITVLDALASGGEEITTLIPETRSLSPGRNRVRIDAEDIKGAYLVNVRGDGYTVQIPVGDSAERAETTDTKAGIAVLGTVAIIALLLAWFKRELVGIGAEREE
jgi:hypothetical protein